MTSATKYQKGARIQSNVDTADMLWGDAEPSPVHGHLGVGESIVKPTCEGRFTFFSEP